MSDAGFTRKAAAMTTVTFDAPGLGDRSYLISDGEVGVVVDPQRDPFPYLQEAEKLGVSITAVLETHVHNDYLSGGLALSRATGATYAIPAGEPMSFSEEFRALDDGDTVAVGRLEATAIATAGHTAHHLAYLVKFADGGDDEEGGEHVVCTGGSLLVNATGRTDLLGLALAEPLAHSQWRSVRRLLTTLPKHARILPTHGFGSFCSATPTQGDVTGVPTIGRELEQNPAALLDEENFVASLLSDPLPIPAYYRHMAPLNRKGPALPSFAPAPELDAVASPPASSAVGAESSPLPHPTPSVASAMVPASPPAIANVNALKLAMRVASNTRGQSVARSVACPCFDVLRIGAPKNAEPRRLDSSTD